MNLIISLNSSPYTINFVSIFAEDLKKTLLKEFATMINNTVVFFSRRHTHIQCFLSLNLINLKPHSKPKRKPHRIFC